MPSLSGHTINDLIESLKIRFSKTTPTNLVPTILEQVIPKENVSMGINNILITSSDIISNLNNANAEDIFNVSLEIKYNEFSNVSVFGTQNYVPSVITISDIKKTLGTSSFVIGPTTIYGPFSSSPATFLYTTDNNSIVTIANSLVTILSYGIVNVIAIQQDFTENNTFYLGSQKNFTITINPPISNMYSLSILKQYYTLSELIISYTLSELVTFFTLSELKSYYGITELSQIYGITTLMTVYTIPQLYLIYELNILKDYFSFNELNQYFDETMLNDNGIFRPIVKTLFFSKYMEGSSNNKVVEIYNPTDTNISLDLYAIPYVINGANTAALIDVPEGWFFFPAGAIILANSRYLIVNPSTTIFNPNIANYVPSSNTAYPTGYNGDDGMKLTQFQNITDKTNKQNYSIIDTIGTFTKVSPNNSPWPVAGVPQATQDKTLIRKPTVVRGNSNWDLSVGTNGIDSEWIVYSQNTISSTYPSNVGLPSIYNGVTWSFGDSSPVVIPQVSITNINGLRHISSYNNLIVKTSGIVTAKSTNGFYIQDGVNNTNGSCGLFVYTGVTSSYLSSVSFRDLIEITGTILEYGYNNQLRTTEMSSLTNLTTVSRNNSLPQPINIGKNYNNIPSLTIDNVNINDFNVATSALDFWENYENMLVTIDIPNIVGQKKIFGSFAVTLNMDNPNRKLTKYGGVLLDEIGNPDIIQVCDILMPKDLLYYSVFPGDSISYITGVVAYNYGYFNILPRSSSDFGIVTRGEISGDLYNVRGTASPPAFRSKEALSTLNTPHISIISSNQFNLQVKVNEKRVSDYIRINLKSPHIIFLQEIQDNNGEVNDGVVNSDVTLGLLTDLINSSVYSAYSTRNYNFIYVSPENNQDGGAPGANIRVAVIYDTLSFEPETYYRIGLKEQTSAFNNSRKPLYVKINHKETNDIYHLIVVHNNSKSGDTSPWGSVQPPVQLSLPQRIQQTTYIKSWISANLNKDIDNIIISGDFNDYEFSDSVKILDDNTENRFMKNLVNDINENERYSFYYSGTYNAIDHAIVSSSIYNKIKNLFNTDINIPNKDYARYSDVLTTQFWIESLGEPLLVDHNPLSIRIPL
jgi:predicted extracellular nuclease